jgi:serine/threonine protein kinase/tetratricopeptide (TPR) repeat protein/WD40 repeat protein
MQMNGKGEKDNNRPINKEPVPTASFGLGMAGIGEQIGRYKLLRILGEGGFGIVYLAEQQRPMKRQVALKIIKPGMDSAQVIRRFEAERQALALLDHPNVAHVYDAGTTEAGRPYFVMEYVKGVPITEHCDRQKLTIEDRLRLFVKVCEAIQHAHQKGIIHRDIKPSNIQVCIQGEQLVPKVIDFGVAKALTQPLTERTLVTEQGQMLGTPEYISPEQAEMTNQDIDTRSDIYSLGVVLYELLTGTLPFESGTLRKGSLEQMRQLIRETEPKTPSTRLSSLDLEASTKLAKCFQCDAESLRRKLRGDLDWITLKAMEKDRVRRYQTAHSLAEDIERHLNHEPVSASPPSVVYRVRKFFHRHRSQTIGAAVAAVLLVGIIVIFTMYLQLRQERIEAESFDHRRVLSQALNLFNQRDLVGALKQVESILQSKHVGPDAHLLRAGILVEGHQPDEARNELKDLLDERPEIAGAAYALLARIIWEGQSLGPEQLKMVEKYRQMAEKLLPKTAEAYYLQAMLTVTIPKKLKLLDEALSLNKKHYSSRRLRALTYQASRKYKDLYEDALLMTYSDPNDPLGHSLLATALKELGEYQKAVNCYDEAIELLTSRDDPLYIELNAGRCEALIRMGDYERANAETQACLKVAPDAAILHYHAFCALTALGKYKQASTHYWRIPESDFIAAMGPRHWPMKHVFDTLEAGGTWHPPDSKPEGPAFLPMFEAEKTYRNLTAKNTRRLISDGFKPGWSPDGKQVAFSLGFVGYSGIAVYDMKSPETNLLIVPGKDPSWSPDGEHIVFVRDCEVLRLSELTTVERGFHHRALVEEEVWVMNADGSEPRRLARGAGWPSWKDTTHVYYQSRSGHEPQGLYLISIEDRQAQPELVLECPDEYPVVSPDNRYVAYDNDNVLQITDLASQSNAAGWVGPFEVFSGGWSPDSRQFAYGGGARVRIRTGLWIYDIDEKEAVKVLSGQISLAYWSPDSKQLLFQLPVPYNEIWIANIDNGLSTIEVLGPAMTAREHFLERIEDCNWKLQVDPNLFYEHWERTASALWIGDNRASLYMQELGLAVDRVPRHVYKCYLQAGTMLSRPAFRDRLMQLNILLARKAAEKEPGYARHFAYILEVFGQQEEADHLWTLAKPTANFLVNGGFEDGIFIPWFRYGYPTTEVVTELVGAAVPEASIEGKFCLYVYVANSTVNASDIGLVPRGVDFEAGKKYTISAFLKARKGSLDITFKPQLGIKPWDEYGEKIITITDRWAEYHVTTPVFTKNVRPASFNFHIGHAPGGFWIDDVKFYEGDYVPTIIEK